MSVSVRACAALLTDLLPGFPAFARAILKFGIVLLAGCAGSGEGLDANGRPLPAGVAPPPGEEQPLQPTIESIQDHVFTPICAECHHGAAASQGLRLEDAQTSYDMLVNMRSTEVPAFFRVAPGDAQNSYLIQKLEGRQASGERMPRGRPPLDEKTIAVIRQWIDAGAAPPKSGKSQPFFLPAVELPRAP